jgi:protein SCO1/2
MPRNTTLATVFAVLFLCFALANGTSATNLSGTVESIGDDHRASIRLGDGKMREVILPVGDRDYIKAGDRIRGVVVPQEEGDLLELIWPDDPKVMAQMVAVNNQLRRDTEVRGRKVFRSVGESLPPFALYNQFGDLVRQRDLRGKTCVINFIFTRCMNPRMCPAATARMQQLQEHIKSEGLDDVLFLSMTLDPDYDTPGILNAYASARRIDGSNFYFLAGPQQALLDLKEQLGILSEKDPKWIIDHTMRTILADPSGKIVYQVPGSMWDVDDFTARIQKTMEVGEEDVR